MQNGLLFSNENRTRGYKYKLVKERSRLEIRKHFFSQRVISLWNGLPSHVVDADSVNAFKNRYDRHVADRASRRAQ